LFFCATLSRGMHQCLMLTQAVAKILFNGFLQFPQNFQKDEED
jgi:hypothetical protein